MPLESHGDPRRLLPPAMEDRLFGWLSRAAGALLLAAVGEGWCFLLNGVSYIAVITGLLLMKLPARQTADALHALSGVVEGFIFVRRTMPVRDLLLLVGLLAAREFVGRSPERPGALQPLESAEDKPIAVNGVAVTPRKAAACEQICDPATRMSREEWAQACRRVEGEPQR